MAGLRYLTTQGEVGLAMIGYSVVVIYTLNDNVR